LVGLIVLRIRNTDSHVADPELVQMDILPTHRGLNDVVQHGEARVSADHDLAPDERRRIDEFDIQCEQGRGRVLASSGHGASLISFFPFYGSFAPASIRSTKNAGNLDGHPGAGRHGATSPRCELR
jgi:hypothetical protein